MEWLAQELSTIREKGIWRELSLPQGIDFSSNDYLGLATNSKIRDILIEALKSGIALGASGSRLLRGNSHVHEELENYIATYFASEAAILFNSGYSANLGIISALADAETEIFSDALNHASIVDGIKLSKARYKIFPHNDMAGLRKILQESTVHKKIIVSESVFSMDGDLAPLKELFFLAQEFQAILLIDEAHATGIYGAHGLGRCEEFKINGVEWIGLHTCGKALGSYGAFLTCSKKIRDICINKARSFIFSTALPPILLVQIRAALENIREEPWRRIHLRELYQKFLKPSPIIPIILGSNERVMRAAKFLQERGMDVRGIRYPTVASGQERLRITVNANLTLTDIDQLQNAIQEFFQWEKSA